jgi:hypothetical protein
MPALRTRAPMVRVATLAAVSGQAQGADEGALDYSEPSVGQAAHRLAARRARPRSFWMYGEGLSAPANPHRVSGITS